MTDETKETASLTMHEPQISQINKAKLYQIIDEFLGQNGRVKRCGWPKITEKYNLYHGTSYKQTQLRNFYIRNKKKNERDEIATDNVTNVQENTSTAMQKEDFISSNAEIGLDKVGLEILSKLKEYFHNLKIEGMEKWKLHQNFLH